MGRLPNIVMSLKNFWTTHKKNSLMTSMRARLEETVDRALHTAAKDTISDICHILVGHKMSNFSRVKIVNFEF